MDRSTSRSVLCKACALFMAFWLFMMPQIMFSSTVLSICDEYGSTPPPLVEEEEVHEAAFPPSMPLAYVYALNDRHDVKLPHWEVLLPRMLHGDVPHLPPWA